MRKFAHWQRFYLPVDNDLPYGVDCRKKRPVPAGGLWYHQVMNSGRGPVWLGAEYRAIDGLLLNVMSVPAVQGSGFYESKPSCRERLVSGLFALAASIIVTVAYHAGSMELQGPKTDRNLQSSRQTRLPSSRFSRFRLFSRLAFYLFVPEIVVLFCPDPIDGSGPHGFKDPSAPMVPT